MNFFTGLRTVLICVAVAMSIQGCGDSADKPTAPVKTVTKLDGTVENAEILEELCKDWVYNKAKIIKHTREGDLKAAAEARAYFQAFTKDLQAYKANDNHECVARYDTPEYMKRYL
jgi:hypothetical protein